MPSIVTSLVALVGAGVVCLGIVAALVTLGCAFSLLSLMTQPNPFGHLNAEMQAAALNTIISLAFTAAMFKVGSDIVEAA